MLSFNSLSIPRKAVVLLLLTALFLVAGGLYYYQKYQNDLVRRAAFEEYQRVRINYQALKPGSTDFSKVARELEGLLMRYPNQLPFREESLAKILWADALSELDRKKGTAILKEVARNESYPVDKRANAIDFIVNDYELDFIDPSFAGREIFSGRKFGNFLADSGGDVELAVRKLNEWAVAIFPLDIIAHYRIAKWYAGEIYRRQNMPELERSESLAKANEPMTAGDKLFTQYAAIIPVQRRGLAYELKARIIHLSGGDKNQAEDYFKLSLETHRLPPRSIFQRIYITRASLYYAAFLARNYGVAREKDIRALLKPLYDYLAVSQAPQDRNVRLVSFLITARDSQKTDYPFIDFSNKDVVLLAQIYPELGKVIQGLDLRTYVRDHPLETQIIIQ